MPTILTDADVFGTAPAPTAPPAAPVAGILSTEDVFGDQPTKSKAPKPRSEMDIRLGGAGAAAKAVLRNVADFGDMFLSIPGMAVGTVADVGSRIDSLVRGVNPQTAGRVATETRKNVTADYSPTVLRQLVELGIKHVAPDKEEVDATDVQKSMELITRGIEKGGKWVEKKTGGVISSDTFESLVQEGMAVGGLKGSAVLAKKVTPKEKAPKSFGLPPEPAAPPTVQTATGRILRMDEVFPEPALRQTIDANTGVSQTAADLATKARRERRKEARDAFARDPEYADQLARLAEGAEEFRAQTPPAMSAPGGLPQTGPRAVRTGSRDALAEPTLPPARPMPVESGAPPALDSALQKIREGKSFDLTAEERIVMRDVRSAWGTPQMVDAQGRSLGPRQRGSSTTDMNALVAALGVTGALAAYSYFLEEDSNLALGAAVGSVMGARSALGPLLKEGGYTLKTLERLPHNRTEFTRDQVMQQLNRQDVSKAERNLVMQVLGEKQTISAAELVEGFKREAKALELKAETTGEWADFGLDSIGRYTEEMIDPDFSARPPQGYTGVEKPISARTTVYRNELLDSTKNHFEDPNYFAHTRSFDEGGVRHVVEIQSDVAQHAKPLSPAERAEAQATEATMKTLWGEASEVFRVVGDPRSTVNMIVDVLDQYEQVLKPEVRLDVKMRLGESIMDRLTERAGTIGDTPLRERFHRHAAASDFERIYDEAKADFQKAAQTGQLPHEHMGALQDALNNAFFYETSLLRQRLLEQTAKLAGGVATEVSPLLKDWYKRIIREEIAQAGDGPVRFATADTVAKVEGWPRTNPVERQRILDRIAALKNDLENVQRLESIRTAKFEEIDQRASMTSPNHAPKEFLREHERAQSDMLRARYLRQDIERDLLGQEAELARNPDRALSMDEHQSIYDRYKSDIEKFLRNEFKAVQVTDAHGHTWLEVPPQPRGPVKMFGRADTKAVATLAALSGAALAADFLQDDPSLGIDAAAGLLAAASVHARPRTRVVVGAGSATAAFLSSEENRARNAVLTGAVMGVASYARSKNKTIAKWAVDTGEALEIVAGNLSAELRTISPPLLRRFTLHERDLKIREHDAMVRISPLAEGLVRLPNATREAIDVALFTGNRTEALKLIDALDKPDLSKGARDAFRYIDETGAKLDSLGLVRRLNREHFPRIVTDLDGLMAHLGKEGGDFLGRKLAEAATESIKRTGSPLSDIEMSRVVNEHLQAAVNRQQTGQAGILKKRSIREVTQELLPFYATAGDSIAIYARAASREIERAIFFGKDLVKAPDTKAVNVGASVGHLVASERAAGKLHHQELQRLESILKARFGPGERSAHWLTQSYRNIVYAMLLGNPFSALVQFGDAAIAVAVHGLLPTIKSAAATVTGKAKWHLNDFGLVNHISEDLMITSRNALRIGGHEVTSAKFLDKTLKWSGFSFVDEFAKMVHLNAAAAKFEKLAQTQKGIMEIQRLYGSYFGADLPKLVTDLRAKQKTPIVGELIFRELSDTQPITKLEMSQGYLSSPNGRVLYTLKSFMVKQLTLARERGFREIAKGDPASVKRGTEFLLRYSIALGMAGASVSYIQDWLLGRTPSFDTSDVAENVFKAFGWGQYAIDQARKGKALQSVANLVVPPYKLFEEIWATPEELEKLQAGEKANPKGAMYIPLVGKLIYNRMLGGAERSNARREREERAKEE